MRVLREDGEGGLREECVGALRGGGVGGRKGARAVVLAYVWVVGMHMCFSCRRLAA